MSRRRAGAIAKTRARLGVWMYAAPIIAGAVTSSLLAFESRWGPALIALSATNAFGFIVLCMLVHRRTLRTHSSAMRTERMVVSLSRSVRNDHVKLHTEMSNVGQVSERVLREMRMARVATEANPHVLEPNLADSDLTLRLASLSELMLQTLNILDRGRQSTKDMEP